MPDRLGSGIEDERPGFAPASPYPLPRRTPGTGSSRSEFLRAVPMFKGLSDSQRRQLGARAEWVRVRAGEWLFRQDDAGDSLYVVRSGRMEVVIERPSTHVVRALRRGMVVGELALLTRERRSASVRARRDSELLRVSSTDFAELLSHEPRFSLELMRELGRQLRVSRGLEPEERLLPTTIAVMPAGRRSARELAESLRAELAAYGSVALMDEATAGDEPGFGAALDDLEREHERVVLVAERVDGADPWSAFCRRQADRALLVADGAAAPRERSLPAGCDVVLPGPVRPPYAAEWSAAAAPRAFHALDWGEGRARGGLERLARRLAGRSLGVVLSSGGARGLAHIGVLEELLAAELVIDRVGGSSMGAFVGAMLAMGASPAEIRERCREELTVRRPLGDYAIPTVSLLRGRRARAMLIRTFGAETTIEGLPREFFCVSCDLVTGEQVVHRRGLLFEAVGASMCLPGMFPPIARDGRLLVDGGVLESLPVEAMAASAEGPVVAVDVGRRFERPRPGRMRRSRPALPALKETLARSIVLGSVETAKRARRRADVLIEPDTGACGMLDFDRLDAMVEAGRQAARATLAGGSLSLPMQCLGSFGPPADT